MTANWSPTTWQIDVATALNRASVAATQPLPAVYPGGAADSRTAFRHRADGGYSLAAGGFHELFVGPHAVRASPKFLAQLRADPLGTRLLPRAPSGYPDGWTTPRDWEPDETSPFERRRILNPQPNARKIEQVRKLCRCHCLLHRSWPDR